MRLTICAVGRLKPGAERDLIEKYAKRLQWPLDIVEVEERRKLSPAELKAREGELLNAAIPRDTVRVALDERGMSMTSRKFADKMGNWRDQNRDTVFLIGGAGGMTAALRDSADLTISFGAATWPHMLARVMLVEQIYRAQEILAGHPYHRE